jgi:hydroxymethylbilane synthase
MLIRVGSRGSELALKQTQTVIAELKKLDPTLEAETVVIQTSGDLFYDKNLAVIGGKGLFLKEIEEQLLEGKIDMAVHSMKDVPAQLPEGLVVNSILERENPFDVMLSLKYDSISDLKKGAIVGTSSSRRKAMLLSLRPDLEVVNFRGNVQTRIKKLESGAVDATFLAAAGLNRLGISSYVKELLPLNPFVPAIAQGALAIEYRKKDTVIGNLIKPLIHDETEICVSMERHFLVDMEGDCSMPIAAYARLMEGEKIAFNAVYLSPDGKHKFEVYQECSINKAEEVARLAAFSIREKINAAKKYG